MALIPPYNVYISNMVVVADAVTFWMMDSVDPDVSGTVYIKHSRD